MPTGLSSEDARRQLELDGPNEPAHAKPGFAALRVLLGLFNPLVLILLIAALVSGFLGQRVDATLIVAIVFVGSGIDFWQSYRSQRAIDLLRARVSVTATALRDGKWTEVPRREIVRGDVVHLSAGDLIPADAELTEAIELHVQEAALTGESVPAQKHTGERVFLGTSIVSGAGTALVRATGSRTQFGAIATSLSVQAQPTAFERGIHDFGILILRVVFCLVLFILLAGFLMHRPPFETLLFAIALAVGLTPEFLPVITSVTLAQGALRMARRNVIVKHLAAIQNFGSIDILCSDKTGTLTTGEISIEGAYAALGEKCTRPLALAEINSAAQTGFRSPLDLAILKQCTTPVTCQKRGEIPFDFERRRVSVVVAQDAGRLLIAKGAPESLLEICDSYESADGKMIPFDESSRVRARDAFEFLSRNGMRVLAVAYKSVDAHPSYSIADESTLVMAGYVSFFDLPIPGVAETLAILERDGVEVKIVTGDSEHVAEHLCSQIRLKNRGILNGGAIDGLSDTALEHIAEKSTIFARVNPAQKTRILLALRRRGHVVGFVGDGINDAPSLHAADVGISVFSAADVAREAADIILLERGLHVLQRGVLEGRRAFGNVIKYLLMGTSSNFGNMLSMAVASVVLPFLPMLPTQILLNNLLYDVAQLTIPTDHVDQNFMRKPQRWNIGLIRNFMLVIGPVSSLYDLLTFWVLLSLFHANEATFHTGWFVESLVTQTLVLLVIRTMRNPLANRPSLPLLITTVSVAAVAFLLPYTPGLSILGFVPLPASFVLFVLSATVAYLALVQWLKGMIFRNGHPIQRG